LFEREHHLRIALILQSLDAETLAQRGCFFGGGTAIVLSHGEYRESLDIDFLVSDLAGYRDLRHSITGQGGIHTILRPNSELTLAREVRSDQYGIRTMFVAGGTQIKFEIVHEGRIALETPSFTDRICGVTTLTSLDMGTTKLLANSDRWSDDAVFSRDLIDLAMLKLPRSLLTQAIAKATLAYGDSIERDLEKAIQSLKSRSHRLDECMKALRMDSVPKAILWERIRKLKTTFRD
jgi:hypothetical protein